MSDSPTSQYWNRVVFYAVAQHKVKYGVPATWLYSESGHGKGACDGIGGTIKRMANSAVKTRKAVIQNAKDFHAWASHTESEITPLFVSHEYCAEVGNSLKGLTMKSIKGTLLTHVLWHQSWTRVALLQLQLEIPLVYVSNVLEV
jgi:hypothetical protein